MKNKKLTLIVPWWANPGQLHSFFRDNTGKSVYTMSGWERWANDPKSPGLHALRESNKTHVRKYA